MTQTKESFNKAISFINRQGLTEFLDWLEKETDYFTAPASTMYHSNYEGGLLIHSLNVTRFALHNFNFIVKEKPEYEYLRESVVLCGLFHDVAKCNTYVPAEKWYKDSENKWKSYSGYEVNDMFPYGHGEKSVLLISKYMKLTDVEALAIRWHMGACEPSTIIMNNPQYYAYNQAINHPLVRLIHCADMLSMTIEEIKNPKV